MTPNLRTALRELSAVDVIEAANELAVTLRDNPPDGAIDPALVRLRGIVAVAQAELASDRPASPARPKRDPENDVPP